MSLVFEPDWLRRAPPIPGTGLMEEEGIFYFLRSEPRVRAAVSAAASCPVSSSKAGRLLADAVGSRHLVTIVGARPPPPGASAGRPIQACLEAVSGQDGKRFELGVVREATDRLTVVTIKLLGSR